VAELDDEEQLKDAADGCGLQQEYLQAVHARLKDEVGNRVLPLLLGLLKENDFWLRAVHAPKICGVLEIELLELSYYRDIYVWLPDVRWGQEAMPPCPNCLSSQLVGAHGWRDNYFGRRITGLVTHYFVISRRYKCLGCAGAAAELKSAKEAAASVASAAAAAAAHAAASAAAMADEVIYVCARGSSLLAPSLNTAALACPRFFFLGRGRGAPCPCDRRRRSYRRGCRRRRLADPLHLHGPQLGLAPAPALQLRARVSRLPHAPRWA
jgi:hypothetical protein